MTSMIIMSIIVVVVMTLPGSIIVAIVASMFVIVTLRLLVKPSVLLSFHITAGQLIIATIRRSAAGGVFP